MRMLSIALLLSLAAGCASQLAPPPSSQTTLPIIDMHLHAEAAAASGPPPVGGCAPWPEFLTWDPRDDLPAAFLAMLKKPGCADPVWSPETDDALMNATFEILRRRNIIGVLSAGDETPNNPMGRVTRWREAAPDRVIPALGFGLGQNCGPKIDGHCVTPDEVARLHEQGRFVVFGEVGNQYEGIGPSDEVFDPYLAMAEARDIPVGIHIGIGPSGVVYMGSPRYRARLHSPLLLEEALVRHPKLRVYVMHAGWPMTDDLLALMWGHPHVYVDVGAIVWALPRAEFHRFLQRIVESGFGKRVMFGSDQMNWPGVIERGLETIESAPFLSDGQKRDILYNNAARFLRLSDAQIAAHHGRGGRL